jgi:hypothetical protein
MIQVEKTLEVEPGVRYPRCIAGKRACPPEDCGGPWGYGDFLEAIQNASHPEHEAWWNGAAASLTRRCSTSKPSTRNCGDLIEAGLERRNES